MKVNKKFWNEFRKAYDRLPVWLPGTAMEVGDIGLIGGRGWEKLTSLSELGVDYSSREIASDVSYSYASAQSVEITGLAQAQIGLAGAPAEAAGGMKVSFNRGGAFVIRAENCRHHELEHLLKVETAISRLASSGTWGSRRWVLVTQVVTAQPAIVLIAQAAGAEATVEVRVAAGAPILAQLSDMQGGLRLAHESSLDAHILSVQRIPIMWRGRRRRGWPWPGTRDLGEPEPAAIEPQSEAVTFLDFMPSGEELDEM